MNCDPIAPWYRWLEYVTFGPYLSRCRYHYLDRMQKATRVLMVGDGDGRFLRRFLLCNAVAHVDWIDRSRAMLDLAQSRMPTSGRGRVTFRHGDIFDQKLPLKHYDLIVTHFLIDCFSQAEVATLISKIASSAAPCAHWVLSEFQIPAQSRLRFLMARIISAMYRFFRWLTQLQAQALPQYEPLLWAHGFEQRHRADYLHGFLTTQHWENCNSASN